MQHIMNNVEALWPRINATYKYDSQENKSVRCDPKDPAAAYEMSFRMTAAQAKELWGKMVEAYNLKKQAGWPDAPNNPMKEDEGCYIPLFPPPITATFLSLKKNPSQVAHADKP